MKPANPVDRTVSTLREEMFAVDDGTPLGSEEELLARLGVSRPTLRQAVRLLEQQGLIRVRRGPGGGYFAARPDMNIVIDAVSVYLRSRDASVEDVVTVAQMFNVEVARRAALSGPGGARDRLGAVVESLSARGLALGDADAFSADETRLSEAIYALVGSVALDLIIHVFNNYAVHVAGFSLFDGRPDRQATWRAMRLDMARAVLAGDGDRAAARSIELNRLSAEWLREQRAAAETEASPVT
jgi:GntR family transcriptional regulator, transcriptional repressor for pyruvate dehydrogenase complex